MMAEVGEVEKAKARTRVPSQRRGIDTRQRLVEAGMELFADEGYHGTNSKRIAARAGVAIGSFYAYFQDKKELFLAALDEYNRTITDRVSASRPEPSDLLDREQLLGGYIRQILDAHSVFPAFQREVELMRQIDPDVGLIMDQQDRAQREMALRYLSDWGEQINVGSLEAAGFLVFATVESVVHAVALGEADLDSEELIRELITMICRYLFPSGSSA